MRPRFKNKELSWLQYLCFRLLQRMLPEAFDIILDHEVAYRRNRLCREDPDTDPLGAEYPDIDTIRKEWGLPTTLESIERLGRSLQEYEEKAKKAKRPRSAWFRV